MSLTHASDHISQRRGVGVQAFYDLINGVGDVSLVVVQ